MLFTCNRHRITISHTTLSSLLTNCRSGIKAQTKAKSITSTLRGALGEQRQSEQFYLDSTMNIGL